jgi:hypothetical protein
MLVQCYGSEFDIPDSLIYKFVKEFEGLPGSPDRDLIHHLRGSVDEMVEIAADDPEVLQERAYRTDFIRALAIQQALVKLGIMYDS